MSFQVTNCIGPLLDLSPNGLKVTKKGNDGWNTTIRGTRQVTSGKHIWTVKTSHKFAFVGVAPSNIDLSQYRIFEKFGYFIYCYNSHIYSGPPLKYTDHYFGSAEVKEVSVVLDCDHGTVGFIADGKDLGVAFNGILKDNYSLCICLSNQNESVELLNYKEL